MTNTKLYEVVDKIEKLPEMFSIAIRVAKAIQDPDVNAEQLAKIISPDQSLTTQLLKLCNSAEYGYSKKTATIKEAIPRLGFKTIKNLVFIAISQGVLTKPLKGYDLEKGALWQNSISCAVYARHLSKVVGYPDPDIAFTAGLLRDIGKLIIHEYIGESYDQIVELVNSENITFAQAEEQILGFNHTEIGARVAEKWNFPSLLTEAIRYHHSPNTAKDFNDIKLLSIVHIADAITMMLGSGMGNDGMMYKIEMSALEALQIPATPASIEKIISDMVELNEEIQNMTGLVNE